MSVNNAHLIYPRRNFPLRSFVPINKGIQRRFQMVFGVLKVKGRDSFKGEFVLLSDQFTLNKENLLKQNGYLLGFFRIQIISKSFSSKGPGRPI